MSIFIRSLIFNTLFYIWTFIIVTGALPGLFLGRHWVHYASRYWGLGVKQLLRIVGIEVEIRGQAYLPSGSVIVASKHQSVWETTMIEVLMPEAVIILKKELTLIPLFGHLLLRVGMISIDRSKGRSVIPQMIEGAKRAIAQGRPLFIFPEGTRTKAGERGTYRHGIYALYHGTGLSVVPAAHNAGFFWPRRQFLKYPGKIIFEFLPPIKPNLSKQDFMKNLENSIETAADNLNPLKNTPSLKTHKKALKRPSRLFILASIFFIGLMTYILLWLKEAHQLEARIKNKIAFINQSDFASFRYERLKITGFPWKLEVKLKNPHFTYSRYGTAHIKIDGKLEIESAIWAPKTMRVQSLGETKIIYSPAPLLAKIKLKFEDFEGIFEASKKRYILKNFSLYDLRLKVLKRALEIEKVSLSRVLQKNNTSIIQTIPSPKAAALNNQPPGAIAPSENLTSFNLRIYRIKMDEALVPALPTVIDSLEATAHLEEEFNLFTQAPLKDWAEKGGFLEIEKLAFEWGDLSAEGAGTLALDHELQPLAAFSATISGLEPLLDQLSTRRVIRKDMASIVKFSLGLFRVDPITHQDSPKHKVALSLQKGDFSIGPVTIAKLPKLEWPYAAKDHLFPSLTQEKK